MSIGRDSQEDLLEDKGLLHHPSGIDYFAITKGIPDSITAFAVGR